MTQDTLDFAIVPKPPPMPIRQLVAEVKEEQQDYEFYPTTDEMIRAMIRDMGRRDCPRGSVLDVGAGNGKVLRALKDAKLGYHNDQGFSHLYAIEKSRVLCQQLDADIFIVGTEFHEQSLLSKRVDVVFSNPPYSEFVAWTEKIIRQSASQAIYLIIPERWKSEIKIQDALTYREAEAKTVGSFDFQDAERASRAKVDLIRIDLNCERHRSAEYPNDAFERFFKEQFATMFEKFGGANDDEECKRAYEEKRKAKWSQLVIGPTYPEAMVSIYNAELAHIEHNYKLVSELDADLLREFDISPERIMSCLNTRLSGLRSDYWHELFSRLSAITDRLTSASRKKLLETLHANVHVDFTLENIYAVIVWVIKNANQYIDEQLLDVYELMVSKANVVLYKSNQKTFRDEQWRYCRDDHDKPSHYALDYRIVTHRVGGVNDSQYSFERGLSERGSDFLGDLLTIARNLGFPTTTVDPRLNYNGRRDSWTAGTLEEFHYCRDKKAASILFDVRGFKNGNLHLRLNKKFILALNVEHGRLKGWLRNASQAVEELRDVSAADYFSTNARLNAGAPLLALQGTNP